MRLFRSPLLMMAMLFLAADISAALYAQLVVPDDNSAPHLSDEDAAASAHDTAPTFTLTLTGGLRNKGMTEFRLGATVWITIVQTNIASHTIQTSGAYSGSINKEFTYEVLEEDGTPAKRVQHLHPELDAISPFWSGLRPGQSELDEQQLNKIYRLDHPGKYFVTVCRKERVVKDANGQPLVEKSNVITLTVLPQTASATNDQKIPQS